MSCSAQFDSNDNYYCPYCSYKQAMIGTRKARKKALLAKKALSVFLDKGMVDGHLQKQKAERVGRKETEPSKVLVDTKHDDTGNKVYGDEAGNHSVQLEEDQREEGFDVECMTTICIHEVNERNDALSRCGDDARTDDGGQRNIVIEQHMQPGLIIACGDGGACSRKRDTGHRYEIVQVDNSVQERVLQGELAELQAGPLSASSVEKEKNIVEEELDSAEIVKEHGGRR
ncbi:uncharacterized protein LOC130761242 isoform X1 [Actinidia eriantha]|uniref:uncharacterized protein LOC130761242 isoform X1 n=1 Tax=Actinidia eriantha TaxID=165200 RepID=UPI0025880A08|nr:uncharacterized protein LOC130761242 isoform X1 [Actinidia eriantha]XP_057472711.1 uncharacterized protein LOC130761242 isoform X1 [Actinidia eriantha]